MLVRALSGIVYIALLFGSVLAGPWWFLLFCTAIGIVALYEYQKHVVGSWNMIWLGVGATIQIALAFWAQNQLPGQVVVGAMGCLSLVALQSLFETNGTFETSMKRVAGWLYVSVPLGLMLPLAFVAQKYEAERVLGLFLLIWTNDTFAYLTGRMFGKRKLFEKWSPNKTWEGALGGAIACLCIAVLVLGHWFEVETPLSWGIIGLMVSIFGTLGDLIESQLKRNAGIKDSGSLMPGHGGALDRFDSVLMVTPMVYLWCVAIRWF